MMVGTAAAALAALALLVVLIALGAYLALRLTRRSRAAEASARALLDRRLALGEIDVEDYYEREAILRRAEPTPRRTPGP